MTSPRTRVVLVEEDRTLCQRVERVLLRADHAILVAVCPDAECAVRNLVDEQLRADIAIVDVACGVDLIHRLTAERNDLTTFLLAHAEDDAQIFAALRLGASAYLIETEDLVALRDRLVMLLLGGATMTPALAKQVLEARLELTDAETATVNRVENGDALTPADPSVIRGVYRKLGSSVRSDSVRELYRRRNE